MGARAQTLQFTNGDRLSGSWLKVEGTAIDYHSDALGDISVPVAKVAGLTIDQPVVVVLHNASVLRASSAQFADGSWTVDTQGRPVKVAAGDVASILPAASYHAAVSEHPWEPWRGWKGNAALGFSLQNGDQTAHTVSVGMNAVRRQPNLEGVAERWRTTYAFNLLFAAASTKGETISSNSLTASLRQDYFFKPHNFLFVLGQADHIQSQNLYLQQTYGGGYGRDLLTGTRVELSLLAGASFANQKFLKTPAQQFAEALVGEHATILLTKRIHLDDAFNFYPNLTARGQYRFDTTAALAFQLVKRLTANFGLTDFYVSHIPSGSTTTVTTIGAGGAVTTVSFPAHHNNLALTAGLGVNF